MSVVGGRMHVGTNLCVHPENGNHRSCRGWPCAYPLNTAMLSEPVTLRSGHFLTVWHHRHSEDPFAGDALEVFTVQSN